MTAGGTESSAPTLASGGLTDHQAKYYALELLRKSPAGETSRIGTALLDAQVDLNPHQVDAALFAFQSPLSKGVILADEVGLGKTIEAGLVMTQRWAEGRRRMLVVCPASLRKQWVQELAEKFFLPAVILETKSFNRAIKDGVRNPFETPSDDRAVVVCSYNFAARRADELAAARWDLAVLDEAHRLRNVYKPGTKIAAAIRTALSNTPKLLLTATPLQNSLMELYGLVSVIDEHYFGDPKSFSAQYSHLRHGTRFEDLKARLEPVCHRTLRRQVVEYVRYTNRVPITQEFWPTPDEQELYDLVSDYLRRPELQALPSAQRSLMILVMRKLLASSTFAIAGALDTLARKLNRQLKDDDRARAEADEIFEDDLSEDFEELDELSEEWGEDEHDDPPVLLTEAQRAALAVEIEELSAFRDLATSITENAKGIALLQALETGFAKAAELGAADKAVIFTESRRTQTYLVELLNRSGYEGQILLFNGSNNDDTSKTVYADWIERHRGSDQVSGSRTADMRAALVDHFRDKARILIATEAAAEGINLQFCSMVVNYDLPWNPQRIEQRIGRCHRYGQRHDVVVVNFLNQANAADQRVYELLFEKFRLFDGVFGASDEVLGAIESGVDIERRIVGIYQDCRTTDEIDAQFTQLRLELDDQITEVMDDTRRKLLEHFDAEVHDRLKVSLAESTAYLDRAADRLWRVTEHVLHPFAQTDGPNRRLTLTSSPPFAADVTPGTYQLGGTDDTVHRYRRQHPLAIAVLDHAANLPTPSVEIDFSYSTWPVRAEALEPLVGQRGWLAVDHLRLESEENEDHLVLTATTDDGLTVSSEQVRRLLDAPASVTGPSADPPPRLDSEAERSMRKLLADISTRHGQWLEDEMDKLDRWADDKRAALKADLREHDDTLKELKRDARAAASLPDKLALQKKIKRIEADRDEAWRAYDAEARKIETAKDELIDDIETRLATRETIDRVMTIRFTVS